MALHLITGYAGTEHVTASNAGALNAASFGTGNKVFNFGKKFEYNLESNNTIRIKDGQGIMNGRHFELAPGTYEDLSIENGAQSSNRKDLVVARYTIDSDTGVESMALKVITGTPSSGTAVDPDYNSGSIIDGDTTVDFPLYRINIIGLNVDSIDTLFSIQENVEDLLGNTSISTIGNGTVTGAISQINTNLSEEITRAKSVEGGKLSLYGFDKLDGVASVAMGYDNSSSALVLDMKLTTGQTHRVSWSNTEMTVAYSTSSGWVTYGTWKVSTT